MKRYVFRLSGVQQLRRAEEEQAREALAVANARLRNAIRLRDEQVARYHEIASVTTATDAESLRSEKAQAALAAEVVDAARHAVAAAAADAALAQVAWSTASRRVKVLERLDERRRLEHAEMARRAEVAVVDDIVTARYLSEHREAARDAARDATARVPGGPR